MLTEKPRIPIRSILLYGFWPGFLKILLYRLKGYRIGKGVSIGLGSVICGDRVEIGDHASIGFFTIVRGENVRLGPHVRIGSLTFLDTPSIEIGEGTRINEMVFVGGLQFPDSRLAVGRNCLIMQMSFINPARPITMGDDCTVGGHCLIFTHSSSLSQFEGYAVDFAPIEIGNGVGLAWRTFVLPGTKIGDGSRVGAGSVVSGTIPPCSLAVGFPARIVGRPPVFPKEVSDEEKVGIFRGIVAEMLRFLDGSGYVCQGDGERYEIRKRNARWRKARKWRIQIAEGDVHTAARHLGDPPPDVFLSLHEIPADVRSSLGSQGVMWIDIENKAQPQVSNDLGEEVISFFRRYGVRTLRTASEPAPGAAPQKASDNQCRLETRY
jgi:acetyltransferase-like isoleucine patch superfamily enzyme